MDKELNISGFTLTAREYETAPSERDRYGLAVYIIFNVPCELWERIMPSDTIREKWKRGAYDLWGSFIRNNDSNLRSFISELSHMSGYNIHLAYGSTLPSSVYSSLSSRGLSAWYGDVCDAAIRLVIYGNNR